MVTVHTTPLYLVSDRDIHVNNLALNESGMAYQQTCDLSVAIVIVVAVIITPPCHIV